MKAAGRCGRLGSLAALKYAVLGLYLLVFLILVGVFILAGKGAAAPRGDASPCNASRVWPRAWHRVSGDTVVALGRVFHSIQRRTIWDPAEAGCRSNAALGIASISSSLGTMP